jgi:mono/diheme cytochrome c family protein
MRLRWLIGLSVTLAGSIIAAVAAPRSPGDNWSFEKVERGRYLAVLGDCVACHTTPNGKPFAGGVALLTPFGKLVGPNITPDVETGLGTWTEEDFLRTMSEGIGHNGIRLFPGMPYPAYTKVTREDASAIWAYLGTLEPVHNLVRGDQLTFPLSVRTNASAWNLINFTPGVFKPNPARSEVWNRGAYLVEGLGHCGTCHTPKNITGGDREGQFLQGTVLQDWYAPNITSDTRRGIGGWSEDEIVRYLKTGANSYDIASGPMADAVENSTSHMTDGDLKAIATYLKSVAGQPDSPASPLAATDRRMAAGAAIYADRCAACHISNGMGIPGLFPRLANAPLVQSTDATSLVRVVLMGDRAGGTAAAATGPAMPSFAWNLTDEQVADMLTYVRNTWGNVAEPVQPSDVAALRSRLKSAVAAGTE